MFAHWGTFTRQGSVNDLLTEAEQAMSARGYQVFNPVSQNNSMVIGGNSDVLIQATSMTGASGQTFNIVSAFSADSATAEQARNAIRDAMPGSVVIDNGTVLAPVDES